MTRELPRSEYTDLFGATEGDRLRLGDTELLAEIERDHTTYGDEAVFGGGKTMRDGMGMQSGVTQAEGALDWVFSNAVVIDPILGIEKGDIGVRNGRIAGVGKAGNPDTMDGVDDDLVVGASTDAVPADGLIATPGGLDIHVHFNSTGLFEHALASGITTMFGGGYGGGATTCTPGPENVKRFLQAAEEWPMNVGFYGKGNSSQPDPLYEQIEAGACGLKLHEDWGSTPAVIDTALDVAEETDVQVCIHTDTLNESGFVEKTFDAIDGRAIHTFHIEGAGGGHAPDVLELVGHEHMLPSSTNPSMPYTENTFDEHLDMVMVCHHLNPDVPEDVAFAESRIRAETLAAEDVLHDRGAISMMTSDSQAMGRMAEVIARTWQTADKMKKQRGPLPEDEGTDADNHRIERYVAKYTINPATVAGIDEYVGSLEPGKMADIVLWEPEFFGIKPKYVIKGGFPVYSQMGEANGSLMTCEPVEMRPRAGAAGKAKNALSVSFVSEAAYERGVGDEYGLDAPVRPVRGTRSVRKADMVHNDYCPDDIDIDAQTFEVSIDGEHVTCEPAEEIALAQRYHL
ncbi:urease alpha subunit [Natronomonas moolapensis 8.8.11]|uniref:Urease subunit alpha n=1 Tax=Natronomonas moolapensis (strain DSM 18674 / CECT 7526 / JCM 14361 / 8.8.11) TaxID=268739 RepID=M1XT57_NATM8|nr:urease subunit alpha [Natronomonas moolapensis]CCQ37593.1 urease alpha subunit [Natronomonas moolapensis 8.8.11]